MSKGKADLSSQRSALGLFVGGLEDLDSQSIRLTEIEVVPQSRKTFNEASLQSLAESIKAQGVLQPVMVRPVGSRYQLVAGERRLRAAKMAGLHEIPALVRTLDDHQALKIMAVENFQREDLNAVEETETVLDILSSETGCDRLEVVSLLKTTRELLRSDKKKASESQPVLSPVQEQMLKVFQELGRYSLESFVVNRLGVLALPEDLKLLVAEKRLPYTRAMRLARVTDEVVRADLVHMHLVDGVDFVVIERHVADFLRQQKASEVGTNPLHAIRQHVLEAKRITTGKKFARLPSEKQQEVEKILALALRQVEKLLE